jgi:plastocyanin
MPNQWSIKIVKLANQTVAFQPDVPGAQPNQPLGVNVGDNITWNNRTNEAHWPVAIAPGGFLTNNIPAGEVSDPIFNVQTTVTYRCLHHPQEHGMIVVVTDLIS